MSTTTFFSGVSAFVLVIATLGASLNSDQEPSTTAPPSATLPAQTPSSDGRTLFMEKGCVHCHGATASGTERGPSLQSAGLTLTREKMRAQVHDGGLTMPAFGEALSDPEMENLLDFLATQKEPIRKPRKRAAH